MNKKGFVWVLLALVAFLWGISFLAIKIALDYCEPMELLAVRWPIAALIFIVLIATGVLKVNLKGKPIWKLGLLALIQPCLYAIFEILGVKYTTTSEASVFLSLVPVMIIILSAIFLKEHYSKKIKMAVFIALLGVVIITVFGPDFSLSGDNRGYLFLLFTITSGASYNLIVKQLDKEFSSIEMSLAMCVSGAICFNIISLIQGNGIHPYTLLFTDINFAIPTLFLGIGCSFLAYWMFNYCLTKIPTGICVCVQVNGVTLVGVIAGILVCHDPFGWYTVVGMILLTFGIAVASLEGNKDL